MSKDLIIIIQKNTRYRALSNSSLLLRDDGRNGVTTLTLNRPERRNALSTALLSEFEEMLDALSHDKSVKVVILAGNGPVFSAGHDLAELRDQPAFDQHHALFQLCSRVMTAITTLPQPVIAKVHGVATAAGCQLVATCDLAVASTDAKFATPGVSIGLFCTTPAVALGRAVGRKQAMEMLLTGDMIDAETALGYGLVNRVVPPSELDRTVMTLATSIAGRSSETIAIGKRTFYEQVDMDIAGAYAHASEVMAKNMMTADAEEGIDAFLEKRDPVWRGR
ncbi:MAG: enoyl-CoA hydratase [Proteobacteria bacterium]|nr:enoyl-CoA hydratase [Pseudomonadota bacterium]